MKRNVLTILVLLLFLTCACGIGGEPMPTPTPTPPPTPTPMPTPMPTPTPTAPPIPTPMPPATTSTETQDDALVIAAINGYNQAFSEGDPDEAIHYLAGPYVARFGCVSDHGFHTPNELGAAMTKAVLRHGRLVSWRVDKITWLYESATGGGFHVAVVYFWRTWENGYVGYYFTRMVKDQTGHFPGYYICGISEEEY